MTPPGHVTVKTDRLVPGEPAFKSRFRWRAERRRDRMNDTIRFPSYRYEVVPWKGGDIVRTMPRPRGTRWAVVAMQNVAEPVE